MLCTEFLERHSDYRDGLITSPRELRRLSKHLAHCATCRRYDVTIRQAVRALHAAAPIAPSADFRRRLDARLAVERRRVPRPPAQTGLSATLLVVAAVALFVFEIAQRPRIARAPLLPPVANPTPVAAAGLPFVSFQDPRAIITQVRSLSPGTRAR
jgi:anti-sigma factor RsiW